MGDVFTRAQRSQIMSKIKGHGNRATEIALIAIFREYRIQGWRRRVKLFGNPDFVFRKSRLTVFVDGCFWHGCPIHGVVPETNTNFWREKIQRNRLRDKLVRRKLTGEGWRVLRIWQHELRDPSKVVRRVNRGLTVIST